MWVLQLLLGLVVVLVITAGTAYFVAQEFAYMTVDRSRLKARAADGDATADRALGVTRQTSFMLSGAQLGITVTGLLVGYVAEPLIGQAVGTALGGVSVPQAVGVGIGTVAALVLATGLQMVLGELFPKNLAIARPEPVALWLARSTRLYLSAFGWLIRIFDASSNLLLRALRIEPVHDVEHSATARDLEHIVAESRRSGDLPEELSVLLDRVLDFPQRDADHAMVPRTRVDALRDDLAAGAVLQRMATGHSRYPVVDADELVVGVVHLTDLLGLGAHQLDEPVRDHARRPVLVPTTMQLPDVVDALAAAKEHMAVVLDEHGGLAGVLTAEDLAEEIVGEIADEHDDADEPALRAASEDGPWTVPGEAHLDELERAVGRDLPRGDYETVAGFVIAQHGALPGVGAAVEVEPPDDPARAEDEPVEPALRFEVLAVHRHVPSSVRVTRVDRTDPPSEGETADRTDRRTAEREEVAPR